MEVMQIVQVVLGICSGALVVAGVLYFFSFKTFVEDEDSDINRDI